MEREDIDDSVIRDLIEQDYNLYDIYIGDLQYITIPENKSLINGHIEYKFTDILGESQFGIIDVKRYFDIKRKKSIDEILIDENH